MRFDRRWLRVLGFFVYGSCGFGSSKVLFFIGGMV